MGDEIRRFNKVDWYGWAGATKFKYGSQPFIYEQTLDNGSVSLTLIADATGISLFLMTDSDDFEDIAWMMDRELTPFQAAGEMNAMAKALKAFTCASDLSYALDHAKIPEFDRFEFQGIF